MEDVRREGVRECVIWYVIWCVIGCIIGCVIGCVTGCVIGCMIRCGTFFMLFLSGGSMTTDGNRSDVIPRVCKEVGQSV